MKTTTSILNTLFFLRSGARALAAALLCLSLAACDTLDSNSDIDPLETDFRTLETMTPEQFDAMTLEELETLVANASKKQANGQPVGLQVSQSPIDGAWDHMSSNDPSARLGSVSFTTTSTLPRLDIHSGTVVGSTDCKDFRGRFVTWRSRTTGRHHFATRVRIVASRCDTLMQDDLIDALQRANFYKFGEGDLYFGSYRSDDVLILQPVYGKEAGTGEDSYSDSDSSGENNDSNGGSFTDSNDDDNNDDGGYVGPPLIGGEEGK